MLDLNMIIANNIQAELNKENKKQVDLAEEIGVSKQTMSKIMNGARAINAVELHKISEYLHVSMNSLMKMPEKPMDTNVIHEENGRCEAAEVAALCLANLYNSGGHRKITPDEYETIKKYLQKFPESMHIRAAFIIASEAIYSPSAEYKRVPDKIINKAKQWSEQYPKKIEFQEAYFGLLFSRLKYAQAQDMRNEQRRVYREMKTVAERANYSEYNESNQLMESVDILHRVFGY